MNGLEMKYFVLNPESKHAKDDYAQASRWAMRSYAKRIERVNPELACAIKKWVRKCSIKATSLEYEARDKVKNSQEEKVRVEEPKIKEWREYEPTESGDMRN